MSNPPSTQPFVYPPSSPEEATLRRLLLGAILEFGAPHAFESGAMTRSLEGPKKSPVSPAAAPALDYAMLQEEGTGYSILAAARTVYSPQTPVEPLRFAAEFFTLKGSAVIDVALPSQYAAHEPQRERVSEEKAGPHMRVELINSSKKTKLEDVLNAFMINRGVADVFKPLLTIMHQQAHVKGAQPLTPAHMKLLADFMKAYFGDFSQKIPPGVKTAESSGEEIIPETPAEVAQSDHWMRGVGLGIAKIKPPKL